MKLFPEARIIKGRIVIGEKTEWKSLDGDNLYVLEVTPVYWSDYGYYGCYDQTNNNYTI